MNDDQPIHLGYSRNQLKDAFNKVQNTDNWKNPISALIKTEDVSIIDAAIGFYAGGGAVYKNCGGGFTRVMAPGYYATIGA